jgi:hypothetical protein
VTPLVAWCLALLTSLAAREHVEARATPELAAGIVAGAEAEPVFAGDDGVRKTVALDVALAWLESRFDPHAVGDHGSARGLFQVHAPELPTVEAQTRAANRLLRASFRACGSGDEGLAWYAAGGASGCTSEGGTRASRGRMALARWLLHHVPPDS